MDQIQAECCGKQYHQIAFDFDNKNTDIRMCIHCYVGLNMHEGNRDIVNYYINFFSRDHDSNNCNNIVQFGKCMLCDYNCAKENKFEMKTLYNHHIDKGKNIKYKENFTIDV